MSERGLVLRGLVCTGGVADSVAEDMRGTIKRVYFDI